MVKPDHLGDLILSSPAIRAMGLSHPDLTLFVAGRCYGLAKWLFPGLDIRILNLAHLAKVDAAEEPSPDLGAFDAVAFLRRDGVLTPDWAQLRTRRSVMFREDNNTHQTLLDYGVAREFAPPYDIDDLFFAQRGMRTAEERSRSSSRIGLSIGSGFYTNAWPLVRWIELARKLSRRGHEVSIVCGPAEAAIADILLAEADLAPTRLIKGGTDLAAFSAAVGDLDLVVASDGGTAHLCSLTTPIVSIFGSSPFRRYAPFGRSNRIVTQLLGCSPCLQYAARVVNGCLSVECMAAITAEDVLSALDKPVGGNANVLSVPLRPGLVLQTGLSHANQEREIAAREQEAAAWRQ